MLHIARLEQDLLGIIPSELKQTGDCIDLAIPKDRTFTAPDVLRTLQAYDPTRIWRAHAVQHRITATCLTSLGRSEHGPLEGIVRLITMPAWTPNPSRVRSAAART